MKVLVFTPTYRLEPETVDSILQITPVGPLYVLISRDNPVGDPKLDHLHNYQRGQEAFLAGDYDAMLTIESDMVVPADTLERLAAIDADIALGSYLFRHGPPVLNAARYVKRFKTPGQSISFFPDIIRRNRGKVIQTSGAGLGCALIHRHVLEQIQFRGCHPTFCDWCFTSDCLEAGFVHKCDLGLVCGHKTPEGQILWPDGENVIITEGEQSSKYHTGKV